MWYKWFVTYEAMQYHIWVDYCKTLIKLQLRFKPCNISYLHVLFHSSHDQLLLTFWYIYINHKKNKGKEFFYVTRGFIHVFSVFNRDTVKHSTHIGKWWPWVNVRCLINFQLYHYDSILHFDELYLTNKFS